jgi:hypothetical protein
MLVEYLGMATAFSYQKWYEPTHIMDSKGPFALSRELGLERFPFELMSPVEEVLLELFEAEEGFPVEINGFPVGHFLAVAMYCVGGRIFDNAYSYMMRLTEIEDTATVKNVGSVNVVVLQSSDTTGLQDWRDRYPIEIGVSVIHDDRGEGWALYRFNDNPWVDFTRLIGDERVLFAHAGGFIAKTYDRLSVDEALSLVEKAIIPA